MTALEDLLARYEDAGAMHYGWVAHDLRTAIAADAKAVLALETELADANRQIARLQSGAIIESDLLTAVDMLALAEARIRELEAELKQHRQESCQWQVKAQCLEIDLARALRRVAELDAELAGESK